MDAPLTKSIPGHCAPQVSPKSYLLLSLRTHFNPTIPAIMSFLHQVLSNLTKLAEAPCTRTHRSCHPTIHTPTLQPTMVPALSSPLTKHLPHKAGICMQGTTQSHHSLNMSACWPQVHNHCLQVACSRAIEHISTSPYACLYKTKLHYPSSRATELATCTPHPTSQPLTTPYSKPAPLQPLTHYYRHQSMAGAPSMLLILGKNFQIPHTVVAGRLVGDGRAAAGQ